SGGTPRHRAAQSRFDARIELEESVHPRGVEETAHGAIGRRQHHPRPASLRKADGREQGPQSGGVDELETGKIDDEGLLLLLRQVGQAAAESQAAFQVQVAADTEQEMIGPADEIECEHKSLLTTNWPDRPRRLAR